jgi:hypothetical protein
MGIIGSHLDLTSRLHRHQAQAGTEDGLPLAQYGGPCAHSG